MNNANFICHTIVSGSRVYSLDGNNGLMAFSINDPRLTLQRIGSKDVLSWNLFPGFSLQATPSIAAPVTWTNVPGVTTNAGFNVVTNTPVGNQLFYRLKK